MFTKTELLLIEELRVQDAPLARWGKFFPDAKISDLINCGAPKHALKEIPPHEFAKRMKKGNIYKWDVMQDNYLSTMFNMNVPIPGMIDCLKYAFGIDRTQGAITSRLDYLGLT